MEITFEEELLRNGANQCLSSEQMEPFYNKMKKLVVLIEVLGQKYWDHDGYEIQAIMHGGGVFIDDSGIILTCSHVILEDFEKILFRCVDEIDFREAKVIKREERLDLALLQPLKKREVHENFVKFANADSIRVGMEIISISHVDDLVYSFIIGQVVYPCDVLSRTDPRSKKGAICITPHLRIAGDVIWRDENDLASYPPDMHLIQMNNMHGGPGASGCPVFNSAGLLIGLVIFIEKGFDFCVHVNKLREFIGNRKSRRQRQRKMQRQRT